MIPGVVGEAPAHMGWRENGEGEGEANGWMVGILSMDQVEGP